MRFLGYAFLTLTSLGLLGAMAAIGIFAWIINNYGNDIPDYKSLKTYEPDVVTRVYTGDGSLMAEFAEEKRIFVPIEVIPERVKNAFIAAEDKHFYTHKGLDYIGIARAMIHNIKNIGTGDLQGASTITQQVAKNFLLTNERTYERKLKEAILAIRIERAMEKDRLLELYLNEIYLGIGTYGVAAAAQQYFNKSLDDLTVAETAYLAALPKAPNNYHPVRKKDRAITRRNWVIGRMLEDGYITDSEAEQARNEDLKAVKLEALTQATSAPYFGEEIRRFLQNKYGNDGLYKQGLLVRSSLDPEMQEIATRAFRDGLTAYDLRHGYRGTVATLDSFDDWKTKLADIPVQAGMLEDWKLAVILSKKGNDVELGFVDGTRGKLSQGGIEWGGDKLQERSVIMVTKDEDVFRLRQVPKVQGGMIVMDPHTGRVLAIQGGWDYQNSEFNRATQAKRQPGSAFKPFIYLSALEEGFTPATIVLDAPVSFEQGPGLPLWRPQNYSNEFYGPTTLRVGVEKSRNVMTVRLADKVGMEKIAETAKAFGIYDNLPPHLANSLGSQETTLERMAAAYAMLVNGGKKVSPSFIDRIQDRYGKTVFDRDGRACPNCGDMVAWKEGMPVPTVADNRTQVTSPQHAYQMVSILEGVIQRGTGVRLREIGYPIAGKTGTTNDYKDAWFMGFTPDLVVGVYVGFDDPKSLGNKEAGSRVALPIFKQFIEEALEQKLIDPLPFRVPPGISLVQVNARNGRRAMPGDSQVIWEAFLRGDNPDQQQTVYGGETVTFTEPAVDYSDYFNDIPNTNNGYMSYDPEAVPPQMPNPSMQGTGGIY